MHVHKEVRDEIQIRVVGLVVVLALILVGAALADNEL